MLAPSGAVLQITCLRSVCDAVKDLSYLTVFCAGYLDWLPMLVLQRRSTGDVARRDGAAVQCAGASRFTQHSNPAQRLRESPSCASPTTAMGMALLVIKTMLTIVTVVTQMPTAWATITSTTLTTTRVILTCVMVGRHGDQHDDDNDDVQHNNQCNGDMHTNDGGGDDYANGDDHDNYVGDNADGQLAPVRSEIPIISWRIARSTTEVATCQPEAFWS